MDVLLRKKNRKSKDDAIVNASLASNEPCESTTPACRRSARILAAKKNNALNLGSEGYFSLIRAASKKYVCECQKKFSMNSRKANDVETLTYPRNATEIFKCVKMKSESKTDGDLKMKIRKCYTKKTKKEGDADTNGLVDDVDKTFATGNNNASGGNNNNNIVPNKNCVQKVTNNVLKRKRQTCRKQFRHKDITLYKLGSGNKEPINNKETIQDIFQRRPSQSSLSSKTLADSDESTETNAIVPKPNESSSIATILRNNTCSTVSSSFDSKTESPQQPVEQPTPKRLENDVTAKRPQVAPSQVSRFGPSTYSIESLTAQPPGKHNLPIRIPESRSSIALPLHNSFTYTKPNNGYVIPTTSFSYLSKDSTDSTSLPNVHSSDKIIKPKAVSADFSKTFESASVSNNNNVCVSESNVQVSTATTTFTLTVSTPAIYSMPPLHAPVPVQTTNVASSLAPQTLKRKVVHFEDDRNKLFKGNDYVVPSLQNCVSSPSAFSYPQSNSHSFMPYSRTHPTNSLTSTPSTHSSKKTSILAPSILNYAYCNRPKFGTVQFPAISQELTAKHQPFQVPNTSAHQDQDEFKPPQFKITVNPETKSVKCEEMHHSKLSIGTVEHKEVLKKEELLRTVELKNIKTEVKVPIVHSGKSPTQNETFEKVDEVVKLVAPSHSSPLIISDSESEHESNEEMPVNLSKTEDCKSNLNTAVTAENDSKLLNSTQTLVLKTLNTLTYVVNEIIDKTGDNMLKQEREVLHKLLEGVCRNAVNEEKQEVVVKQENCIDLISDSEPEEEVTDSNGTLDLSVKKSPELAKRPIIKPAAIAIIREPKQKSPEPSVLNLSKDSKLFQNGDNSILNLSMRAKYNEACEKVQSTTCKDPIRSETALSTSLAGINLSKEIVFGAKPSPRVSSAPNAVVHKHPVKLQPAKIGNTNLLTNNLPPSRRASCSFGTRPAEIAQRRSTTDTSIYRPYQDSLHQNQSRFQPPEFCQSMAKQWNRNPQQEYFDTAYFPTTGGLPNAYFDKPGPLPAQPSANYGTVRAPPHFSHMHYNGVPKNPGPRPEYPPRNVGNGQVMWKQYNPKKNPPDKPVKEPRKTKQKQLDPGRSSAFTATVHRPNATPVAKPPSELTRPQFVNPKPNTFVTQRLETVVNNNQYPAFTESKLGSLLTAKQCSFPPSSKNSDTQTYNSNISPDYGYYSPMSKYSVPIETDPKQMQNASTLNTPTVLGIAPESTSQDKSHSPLLNAQDQEKVFKILPNLHTFNTLTPEQYVMEVHILEKYGCPRHFLNFYSYLTKKQIASNQKPVGFRIFLEFQNAGKLTEFEKAFKIYAKKHESEKHVLLDS